MCLFTIGGGAWKNIHREMGERWGLREAGLVVRSKARRPPSLWAALTTHKQSPIYTIWFTKGGEGKMCPFTGTEGTKDTLEALEKGLKK